MTETSFKVGDRVKFIDNPHWNSPWRKALVVNKARAKIIGCGTHTCTVEFDTPVHVNSEYRTRSSISRRSMEICDIEIDEDGNVI